MQFRKKDKGKC